MLPVEIVVCAIATEPRMVKHNATTANRSKPPNLKEGVIWTFLHRVEQS